MKRIISLICVLSIVLGIVVCPTAFAAPKKVKIALVGDSLTQGYIVNGAYSIEKAYSDFLQTDLGPQYEVKNFGLASHGLYEKHEYSYTSTTKYTQSLKYAPDIVISLFGTNDAKVQYWGDIKDSYSQICKDFYKSYQNLDSNPEIIVALPTPVFGDSNFAKDRPESNMNEMRAAVKSAASDMNLTVADTYSPFKSKSDIFEDGLHFNESGAKEFSKILSKIIKNSEKADSIINNVVVKSYQETVLNQLGFASESESKLMTRIELCTILLKIVNYSAYDDGGQSPFTDIDNTYDGYEYLKSSYNLGIISDGKARPNDYVMYNEAVKMIVTAIGYGVYATYKGGYPAGYLNVARDIKLLQGTSAAADGGVSRQDIYNILYNAINAETLQNTGFGDKISFETQPGTTVLSTYHNIVSGEGVCYGVLGNSLLSDISFMKGEVCINNRMLKDKNNICFEYVGYKVEYFYDKDTLEIKAVCAPESTVTKLVGEDVYKYENGILYCERDNGQDAKYNIDKYTKILYNGSAVEEFSESDFTNVNGTVSLINNDDDSYIDCMIINVLESLTVGAVDVSGNAVYDCYDNKKVVIDKDSFDDYVYFKDEFGNEVELKELSYGDVISYYSSKDGNSIIAYYSNSEVIGTIESVSISEGIGTEVVIDGETYAVIPAVAEKEDLKIGLSGAFRLTTDKKIAYVKYDEDSKFAYVIAGKVGDGLDEKYMLKFYNADKKFIEAELADKVNIDGENIKAADAFAILSPGGNIQRQLIRYRMNSLDEITYIDTACVGDNEPTNSLKKSFSSFSDEYGNAREMALTWRDSGMFGGRVPVKEWGVMFVVPKQDDARDEDYFVTTPYAFFKHDYNYMFEAYKVQDNEIISDVLVYKSDVNTMEIDARSGVSVVSDTARVMVDGEDFTRLTLFTGGAEKEMLVKDDNVLKIKLKETDSEYHTLKEGDIIRYAVNDNGYITLIELEYDCENDRFAYDGNENTNRLLADIRIAYGEVYSQSSGIIQFCKGKVSDYSVFNFETLECYKTSRFTIYTYDSKARDNKVRVGGVYDIADYKIAGEGSKMVIQVRSGFDGTIVIYK